MPTRGRLTFGLDGYLETLAQAGQNVDDAVTEVLTDSRFPAGGVMYQHLRSTSETWTGKTAHTLFIDPVKQDGNYIFFELGARLTDSQGAFFKEYGSSRQAAEPFLRPTMIHYRTKELKRIMKLVLERYGLPTS